MPEKMPPDAVGSLPDQVETAVLGGVSANGGELVVASQRRSREKQHSEPQSHLGFCSATPCCGMRYSFLFHALTVR